jgi:ubiquinone/menaquinone biosynthesis C-methylase UbiE
MDRISTDWKKEDLSRLQQARQRAENIARSSRYPEFVTACRAKIPWWFEGNAAAAERDHLRVVDHHLEHLMPLIMPHTRSGVRQVLDFGCGSGGSSVALAMVQSHVHIQGTDIELAQIEVARERASLYGVQDRCRFDFVPAGQPLPFPDESFDLCLCSSVIEYVVDPAARKFCVQEMARLLAPGGALFISVPNRIYPFEIHTMKWGWNYFPKLLRASIVDSTAFEIKNLALPWVLKLHRTPMIQLVTPWSNFCLRRDRTMSNG